MVRVHTMRRIFGPPFPTTLTQLVKELDEARGHRNLLRELRQLQGGPVRGAPTSQGAPTYATEGDFEMF